MDAIDTFLDSMFAPYPSTPRLIDAKAELRAMMEDAYTGAIDEGKSHNEAVGQVVTQFGNLDELAPILGIATDINPPTPTPAPVDPLAPIGHAPSVPMTLTLPQAQEYAEARHDTQPLLARAVALFVLAPIPLVGLTSSPTVVTPLTEDQATWIGLVLTLLTVAIGVAMILRRSGRLAPFRQAAEAGVAVRPEAREWLVQLRASNEGNRRQALSTATVLWIVSAMPILGASLLPTLPQGADNPWIILGVAGTLILVATGFLIYLPSAWASGVIDDVDESAQGANGEYSMPSWFNVFASTYWPGLLIIFFIWGFVFDCWDRAWIVWPIGGVLFGAIAAGTGAWSNIAKT